MRTIFLGLFLLVISGVRSQHIRKNYREMTQTERAHYNQALQILWNNGSTSVHSHEWFALMHKAHFNSNIHTGMNAGHNFTAFHRYFLLHWELMLKRTSQNFEYLCIPFWNWYIDPPKILQPVNATNNPDFWAYSFVPISNFSAWTNLSRPIGFAPGTSPNLPDNADFSKLMLNTTFHGFTTDLEQDNHNGPHVWVGTSSTMFNSDSPHDPIFYSHHAMVDRLWQEFEDMSTGFTAGYSTSWSSNPFTIPGYNIAHGWIDNLNAHNTKDSRYLPFRWNTNQQMTMYDVWYAYSGTVILDGSNNTDFVVSGNNKIYRYTAEVGGQLLGSIYIGDIQRVGTNIAADNKGGFIVPAGTTTHFRAGADITVLPGSEFNANSGSEVTFKIISAPNGF